MTHGGVIRQAILYLLTCYPSTQSLPVDMDQIHHVISPNTSITEFEVLFEPNNEKIVEAQCVQLYDASHLE